MGIDEERLGESVLSVQEVACGSALRHRGPLDSASATRFWHGVLSTLDVKQSAPDFELRDKSKIDRFIEQEAPNDQGATVILVTMPSP